jgi:uncharacterized protein YciI
MKYVVMYETAPDVTAKLVEHFPAHRALWAGYQAEGTLLAIGPFSDQSAAMAVFTTREAAEQFVKEDPFVLNGAIQSWTIREWNEALL